MVSWSGRRKAFTILLFIAPTLVGVLLFNVFPIALNTYVSFTTRNKFHPYPDCSVFLSGVLDPVCWPAFKGRTPVGLGTPYQLQTPLLGNYAGLVGQLFTTQALLALLSFVVVALPFIGVAVYNRRHQDASGTQPIPSGILWLGALVVAIVLGLVLNVSGSFQELMSTGDFMVVVLRTLIFVALRVPLSFAIGLALALILNSQNLPGRTFFRVVLFVPWAASSLAILMALVWQFFFRDQGTINQLLKLLSITGPSWLQNPALAFMAIVVADTWFSYPFFMIVILGALQSVPADAYEAAEIDGATYWQQLTKITLPLIRPAILPATVLTSISAFQMFGTAWALTSGGPVVSAGKPGATEFVMVYAFKQIFQSQNFGTATAFAVILFIFLFAATLFSLRYTRLTKGAYE